MIKHIIDTRQLKDRAFLDGLFLKADRMREGIARGTDMRAHTGKIVCSLFYEPSTRTKISFDSAAKRLGAQVIGTENAREFSSEYKGETLEHAVLAIQDSYDVLVMRHPEDGAAKRAASVLNKTVINAGDGNNQHPTQALLDAYTIRQKLGRIDNLKFGFLGDLKHGRTVKSLAYLLAHMTGNVLFFISPSEFNIDEELLAYLTKAGVKYYQSDDIDNVLPKLDGLYVTRIQWERLQSKEEFARILDKYDDFCITTEKADCMKRDAIIMHPLPKNTTKSNGPPQKQPEVDKHPRAE
jgi:aspartate carbamoyltransferase catalytic subunit